MQAQAKQRQNFKITGNIKSNQKLKVTAIDTESLSKLSRK